MIPNRLIWVKPHTGNPFLLNPAQIAWVIVRPPGHDGREHQCLAVDLVGGEHLVLSDPDGTLLHFLTDGVPEPPRNLCPPPAATGPVPAPGATP